MAEYCSEDNVRRRLTSAGLLHLADDDQDGDVSEENMEDNITTGIEYGGSLIDSHIMKRINLESARNSGNRWLRDRAIDIAVHRIISSGGREVPDSIQGDFDRTMELLQRVRDDGDDIPGLSLIPAGFETNNRQPFEIYTEYST